MGEKVRLGEKSDCGEKLDREESDCREKLDCEKESREKVRLGRKVAQTSVRACANVYA
jgi:hypothetical protein